MINENIGITQDQGWGVQAMLTKQFKHRTACPAHASAILDGHQIVMRSSHLENAFCVYGLNKTHIYHGRIARFGDWQGFVQYGTKAQKSHPFALTADHSTTHRYRFGPSGN